MTKENLYKFLLSLFFLFILIFFSFDSFAEKGKVTKLDIPRFVSLKSNDINLRVGPSENYPIAVKYIQKNLPVEIIKEFKLWRQIKDYDGNIGWIRKNLLRSERYVLTNSKGTIYNRPNGKVIGLIKKRNVVKLIKCLPDWCYITHKDIKGWIYKENIWGIYSEELYNLNFMQPLINIYWGILGGKWLK
jgi:SH3-like domain-containing protein